MLWTGILIVILVGCVFTYNQLVKLSALVDEAWEKFDAQMKRRHDIISQLIAITEKYAADERFLLDEVTAKKNSAEQASSAEECQQCEKELVLGLHKLLTLTESFPALKTDGQFLNLKDKMAEIENNLQKTRRYYNAAVRVYNIALKTFPVAWLARQMKLTPRPFFEAAPAEEASGENNIQ